MIRIILVDDHNMFRMTLKMALSDIPDFQIMGDAESGSTFFTLLKTTPCDIVLLDINLPDMNGIEISCRLRKEYPAVKILAISCESDKEIVQSMLNNGIEGFVSKQIGGVHDIVNAVRSIMNGYEYFGNDISKIIYQIYVAKKEDEEIISEFTDREKEIIKLCRDGLIAKEIADKLNISINTVRNHKTNIFQKLNINNTVEMVQYALKNKIISLG
jgi:DNA-binding NarL/FixJ family response regulator